MKEKLIELENEIKYLRDQLGIQEKIVYFSEKELRQIKVEIAKAICINFNDKEMKREYRGGYGSDNDFDRFKGKFIGDQAQQVVKGLQLNSND